MLAQNIGFFILSANFFIFMNGINQNGEKNKKKFDWLPTTILFFKYSAWIVAPLIMALYVGKWLDGKYHTEPWLFLISVGVAFFISMVGLVIEAFRSFKSLEKKAKDKKD